MIIKLNLMKKYRILKKCAPASHNQEIVDPKA